jgi:hypothetical protein
LLAGVGSFLKEDRFFLIKLGNVMMKQKLLATTALVSLVAGSAFAGGPAPSMHNDMSVKIGGQYDAKLIFRDLKNKGLTRLTANNKNFALDTEARILLKQKTLLLKD